MATALEFYKNHTTTQSQSASASYMTHLTCNVDRSGKAGSKTFYVFGTIVIEWETSPSQQVGVRFYQDDSITINECIENYGLIAGHDNTVHGHGWTYSFLRKITLDNSSHNFKLQFQREVGSDNINAEFASICVLEKSANAQDGEQIEANYSDSDSVWKSLLSLSFTATAEPYLIIYGGEAFYDDESDSYSEFRFVHLTDSAIYQLAGDSNFVTGSNDNKWHGMGGVAYDTLAAGTNEFAVQGLGVGGDKVGIRNATIVAIPLSDFENAYKDKQTPTTETFHTGTGYSDSNTDASDTINAADFLVMAGVECSSENGAASTGSWRVVADTVNCDLSNFDDRDEDNDHFYMQSCVYGATLGAGAKTFKIQGTSSSSDPSADGYLGRCFLLVLEIPAEAGVTEKTGSDSGAGAESSELIEKFMTALESGAGAEAIALLAAILATDSGAGVDALIEIIKELLASDSGVGGEYFKRTKIGEFARLFADYSLTDSGAGTDLISLITKVILSSDSGVGADAASELVGALLATDSGAGVDTSAITALISGLDSGTSVESAVLSALLTAIDSAIGAEQATKGVAGEDKTASDSGVGVEALVLFSRLIADSGTGIDTFSALLVALLVTDSVTGADLVIKVIKELFASETGAGVDQLAEAAATTEILRPNAPGDKSEWTPVGETNNWECVDDVTPNEDATYIDTVDTTKTDLYHLPPSSRSGSINKIRVYFRCKISDDTGNGAAKIKTYGTEYMGSLQDMTTGYVDYYEDWAQNPHENAPWTWAEIDALQIGVIAGGDRHCTQVWVEVDYNPPALTALLEKVDSGAGVDTAEIIAKIMAVLDSGSGADAVTALLSVILATDSATGADLLVLLSKALTASDSGVGVDTLTSLLVGLAALDGGAGAEAIANRVLQLVESGVAVDVATKAAITGMAFILRSNIHLFRRLRSHIR